MTEEQVTAWRKRRDEAKKIEDPAAREKALDIVYDMKDDLQLDCQRKMADRIKTLVANDREQGQEITGISSDVAEIKQTLDDHDPVIQDLKRTQVKVQGGWQLLKIVGWIIALGGSSAAGWFAALAQKAAEQ